MQFREDASQFTIFFAKLILLSSVMIFFFLICACTLFHYQFQILVPIFTFWSFIPSSSHYLLMLFPPGAAFVFCCLHIPSIDVFLSISGPIPVDYSNTSIPSLTLSHTASYLLKTLLKQITAHTILWKVIPRDHADTQEQVHFYFAKIT